MDQYWEIESNCESVRLISESFHIETFDDFLYINDEYFTGMVIINKILPNIFTLRFTSDGSGNAPGFKLKWECDVPNQIVGSWVPCPPPDSPGMACLKCNGTTCDTGELELLDYENDMNQYWKIESD